MEMSPFFFSLSGRGFLLGLHVARHHFFFDGVIAPEAEQLPGDSVRRRKRCLRALILPSFLSLGMLAFHQDFHVRRS